MGEMLAAFGTRLGARMLRTRWLVRAPIAIFRGGFGWLLGSRLVLVEHRGRRSGESRYVCLEVVERPRPDRIVIVSGFGERAEWYQNLRADPRCFIWTGRIRHARARVEFLTPNESRQVLERYQVSHPRDWQVLRGVIEAATGRPVEGLPMLSLTVVGPRVSAPGAGHHRR